MQPEALTIAVLMDSMDWFTPTGPEAAEQCRAVNRALKVGGRVLLRSAGLNPVSRSSSLFCFSLMGRGDV